jgi:membrane fusion protein (multidrug efflux system)
MSVDIEDQVENPARTKNEPALREFPIEEPKKGLASPKVRRFLLIGGVVALALIIGLFVYYSGRETTDDAQVDGHITPVASKIYGRVAEVLVLDNQPVKAGQVLVKIDPRD